MSRKKKETNAIEYPWSKFQLAIYEFIEHEQGNLVVEAVAGSGKTTTLVKCLDFIPKNSKVLLTAFNTDIVNELKKKTKERENVECRTLHGLGLMFIKKNLPQVSAVPEPFKYEAYIKNNVKELTSLNIYTLRGREYFRYLDNVKKDGSAVAYDLNDLFTFDSKANAWRPSNTSLGTYYWASGSITVRDGYYKSAMSILAADGKIYDGVAVKRANGTTKAVKSGGVTIAALNM